METNDTLALSYIDTEQDDNVIDIYHDEYYENEGLF
jgi:hypothetical protein